MYNGDNMLIGEKSPTESGGQHDVFNHLYHAVATDAIAGPPRHWKVRV